MPCSGPFRCSASALRHIWSVWLSGVIITSQTGHFLGVTLGAALAAAPAAEGANLRRGSLRFGSAGVGESTRGGWGAAFWNLGEVRLTISCPGSGAPPPLPGGDGGSDGGSCAPEAWWCHRRLRARAAAATAATAPAVAQAQA